MSAMSRSLSAISSFEQACQLVRGWASGFERPWWLIGSAAARLAGADIGTPHDLDLLLSTPDLMRLAARLNIKSTTPPDDQAIFRSRALIRFAGPLPIEAMSELQIRHRTTGHWHRLAPRTRIETSGLFIPAIDEQIEILKRMNRPKDRPRIRALGVLAPHS